MQLTVAQFRRRIRGQEFWPGDLVLMKSGERGGLNWIIARAQRRMLLDLWTDGVEPTREERLEVRPLAAYTHAACILDDVDVGEMYAPRARRVPWAQRLRPGMRLLIRRPHTPYDLRRTPIAGGYGIAHECMRDVQAGTPYPTRELLHYYLMSWGWRKLRCGQRFAEVFRSRAYDVCSGRYWYWCLQANFFPNVPDCDRSTDMHYPAELAQSKWLATVAHVRIVTG